MLLMMNSKGYSQCAPVITGPNTVCTGTTVRYSAYANTPSNLSWSVNGGGTLSGANNNPPNPQVNWVTPGTWQITVSAAGCTASTYTVNVVNASTISAPTQITGPTSTCGGSTSTYSVPAIAGLTPVWLITSINPFAPPPPTLTPSGNQVSVTWPASSNGYKLYASYTNGTCSGQQTTISISTSSGSPVNVFGNSTDKFCLGQSFTFSAYSSDSQDIYTWALTGGGTITPNGNQATVQWTSEGTFTLTATATNPCSPTPRSASRAITVGPAVPSAPGAISKQNTITCKNQTERFSVSAVPGATSY